MDPQQQNNGFGPLSKPRGKAALLAALIVVFLSGAVHVKVTVAYASQEESKDKIHFLVFGTALLMLSVVFGELMRRLCLVIEEIRHKRTRYQGSWKKVFNSTLTFRYDRCISVVVVMSLIIVFHALYEHNKTFYRSDYAILFSLNCFLVPQLLFLIGFRELSIAEVSQINERENKNVADGLAWSYYFGYLKLVLPKLAEQIGKSSLDFRYKISDKKLFILLPKTCFTYDRIVDADPRVKCAGNLEEYQVYRVGKKRSYKHTVHRIEMPRPDGRIDEYHVVLEYATPLMSLYDMSRHPESGLSRQERDQQVVLFIRKLREILDGCPDCRGKYALVPISGEKEEIADVLVQMFHDANLQLDEQ